MEKKSYTIKPDAAYCDTWLVPWVGYTVTIFYKGKSKFFELCGMVDKTNGYFTKANISKYLTPNQNER